MDIPQEARFRLRLTEGFLREARQDLALQRWRSCVDNSQLATENAAKCALALLGPVGRTHNPAVLLRRALARDEYPVSVAEKVKELAECAELLGPDIHVQSDYGDEAAGQTPWELFDEAAAQEALTLAATATQLVHEILETDEGTDS